MAGQEAVSWAMERREAAATRTWGGADGNGGGEVRGGCGRTPKRKRGRRAGQGRSDHEQDGSRGDVTLGDITPSITVKK